MQVRRHGARSGLGCAVWAMLFGQAAMANVTSVSERWQAWERHQELSNSSPYMGLQWRSIGPIAQGGRILDIEQVPGQTFSFYVAYASGGVWRTDDNGVNFRPLSDALPNMISGDLAVDPRQPDVLWLGSGEPNSSRSSYSGLGVFLSEDGGKTFTSKGLAEVDRIGRIAVHPQDSNQVCVAAIGRLYTPGPDRGVYCSYDRGARWEKVLAGRNGWTGAIDLDFHPTDPNVVFAVLWERSRRPWDFQEGGEGSGVWRSDDRGRTWRPVEGLPNGKEIGRMGLAIAASDPNQIYVSIDHQGALPPEQRDLGEFALSPARLRDMSKAEFLIQDPDDVEMLIRFNDLDRALTGKDLIAMVKDDKLSMEQLRARLKNGNAALFDTEIRGLEVYRSRDGGATWARTHDDVLRDFYFTYGYYFGEIDVDPKDPERVFVLGVPTARSTDGGKTFTGAMNQPDVHVDHHALWVDPSHPARLLLGNDGGVDASYDGGDSWTSLDRDPVGQSYAVQFDFAEPYNVYTGLQDNGTWRGSSKSKPDDMNAWTMINGGDGMQIAVDPRDNKTVITGYQFGFYSRNDGKDVRPIEAFDQSPLRFNWQSPVLMSPHNPEVVYKGANKLFRSFDQGVNWQPISPDLTRSKQRGDVPFATLTTISESSKQFGLIWVGTDDGQVHVTEDGGVRWRDLSSSFDGVSWISRVVASQHVRERAYVALNGYRDDNMRAMLYRTDDLGKTFRDIAKGLPAEPINVVLEDSINPDLIYVGTDRGVYVSSDRGGQWQALDGGLPNVPVHDLKLHPRDRELIAGTHGRSVWILDVLPLQSLTAEIRAKATHLFAPAEVQFNRSWRSQPSRWFDRPERKPELMVNYWAKDAGTLELLVKDSEGSLLAKSSMEAKAGLNQFRWNLMLDRELALAAEAKQRAARQKDKADATEAEKEGAIAKAVRLGQSLYIGPGEYTLAVGASEAKLSVKPPKPFEPRVVPAFKVREK